WRMGGLARKRCRIDRSALGGVVEEINDLPVQRTKLIFECDADIRAERDGTRRLINLRRRRVRNPEVIVGIEILEERKLAGREIDQGRCDRTAKDSVRYGCASGAVACRRVRH